MNKLLTPLALLLVLPTVAQDGAGEMLAGMSALRRQDHVTAERSFSQRIEAAPADLDAWYYRAVNRLTMSDRGGAQDDLRRLLNAYPEGPIAEHALFQLGHHAVMDGDMHKARQHYTQLCSIAPHQAMAWCNLGIAQAALGLDDEALLSLEKSIDLDDTLDQAHVNRAIVLFRLDEMLLIYCE
jgi:tetratricopeptide (TPR) repeat protein